MILMGKNPLKGKTYEETYSKNKLSEIELDKDSIIERYGEYCYVFLSRMLEKNFKMRYSAEEALNSAFLSANFGKKSLKHHK